MTEDKQAAAAKIDGLEEQLAAANSQIEELAAREANRPALAAQALAEHDPEKGYDALLADAQLTLEEGDKAAEAVRTNSRKTAAATLRNAGALTFMNNTQDALSAYHRATELDPDDMDGWNQLGHLLYRVGDLNEAEQAYVRVGELATKMGDKKADAASLGNLGNLFLTRGDLNRAEEAYKKSLAFNTELGRKEGMASTHGNLGVLYSQRGDFDRAKDAYEKGLALDIELGRKEGMAMKYRNLGILHRIRDELALACENWRKARNLFAEVGIPHQLKKCEAWMGEVGCPNSAGQEAEEA